MAEQEWACPALLRLGLLVCVALLSLVTPALASPQTWHVTTSADSGAGSLRDILTTQAASGDTVVIDPGINPTLTTTTIIIGLTNLTIEGQGARATTISAGGSSGIFDIEAGNSGPAPPVSISDLTLANGSSASGGALLVNAPTALTDVSLVGNSATNGSGGGIDDFSPALTLTRVTGTGNRAGAAGAGGALYVEPTGAATVVDSTFTSNSAGFGGALDSDGSLNLVDDTVSGNSANDGGNLGSGGSVTLTNTIVANGHAVRADASCFLTNEGGVFVSGGGNLEDTTPSQCGLSAGTGDLASVDPQLGPLADNGGPTDTMALLPGSPAIDRIPAASCQSSVDQRGLPRPGVGKTACDIGAYEAQSAVTLVCAPAAVTDAQPSMCTATVTAPAGFAQTTPTGPVSFSSTGSGTFAPTNTCDLAGTGVTATCAVTYTPTAVGSGSHTLTATYGTSASYPGSSGSTTLSVTPVPSKVSGKASPTLALSCSPGTVAVGASTTCTVTVGPAPLGSSPVPTGSVVFSATGGKAVTGGGACTLTATGGTGRCSVHYRLGSAANGTYTISGAYSGDSVYTNGGAMTTVATPPVAGETANISVVSGTVLIKLPSSHTFVPAIAGRSTADAALSPLKGSTLSVPMGSTINALRGKLVLTTAADFQPRTHHHRSLQRGTFSAGLFAVKQLTARQARRRLPHHRRLTGIPATILGLQTPVGALARAGCRRAHKPAKGVVRAITGNATGLFETVAANSITIVHSALWNVQDRCGGSFTEVGRGHATVRPAGHATRHQHTVVVGPGQGVLIKGVFR